MNRSHGKVAVLGGTGFLGRNLTPLLDPKKTVIISRRTGHDVTSIDNLTEAFKGCETVVHAAGINREIGDQTFQKVHVDGTRIVLEAARKAGVKKIILVSFLRARAGTGSPYHETKWAAEEMVRASGLDFTILKTGMVYGKGDHIVDHVAKTIQTVPMFATVGFKEKSISPVPGEEIAAILKAAVDGRLKNQTVPVVGAEELMLSEVVRRIARLVNKRVLLFPAPFLFHKALAQVTEWTMVVPLLAKSQARMLSEGVTHPTPVFDELPEDLRPKLMFSDEQIRKALPPAGGYRKGDLLKSSKKRSKKL